MVGTILLTAVGIIVAFPWALATATYLAEYAEDNFFFGALRLGIDVLAGVPTIVYAIFGLAIFSLPELAFFSSMVEGVAEGKAFGRSFLVSGITMAVMVLPFVIKSCEEAIKAVPQTFREAAFALGVSKWRTISRVILPAARPLGQTLPLALRVVGTFTGCWRLRRNFL
jgi:phosphate transport system permease protein